MTYDRELTLANFNFQCDLSLHILTPCDISHCASRQCDDPMPLPIVKVPGLKYNGGMAPNNLKIKCTGQVVTNFNVELPLDDIKVADMGLEQLVNYAADLVRASIATQASVDFDTTDMSWKFIRNVD